MNITGAVNQLLQTVLTTKEFIELKKFRTVINQNQKSREILNQFQKKQEMAYSNELSEAQLRQLINEIEQDYNKLSAVAEFKHYFAAVDNFNIIVEDVFRAINAGIENNL